jgi:hypothetical protein
MVQNNLVVLGWQHWIDGWHHEENRRIIVC